MLFLYQCAIMSLPTIYETYLTEFADVFSSKLRGESVTDLSELDYK